VTVQALQATFHFFVFSSMCLKSANMLLATGIFLVVAASAKQGTDQMTLGVLESGSVVSVPEAATRKLVRRQSKKAAAQRTETDSEVVDHIAIAGGDFSLAKEEVEHHVEHKYDWIGSAAYCLQSRRRSSYQHKECNSGDPINHHDYDDGTMMSGSKCFGSCNHPNMETYSGEGTSMFSRACNCKPGFQQGPDDDHGSEGICIPCGCMNIVNESGFLVDICPMTYPNGWLKSAVALKDDVILPTLALMEEKIEWIKDHTTQKVTEIKNSLVNATTAAITAIKAFVGSSLLDLHRIHSEEVANFKYEDDGVWDSIKDAFDQIKGALVAASNTAAVSIMEGAKAAFLAAKAAAAALRSAAQALAKRILKDMKELKDMIKAKAKALLALAKEKLKEATEFLHDQWKKLKEMASGVLSLDNFNTQLSITNPSALNAELNSVEVDLDYVPDTEDGGGDHGGTDKINLGKVTIDHTIPFDAYGTTTVEVAAAVGSISIDIGDILDHGLMGFLADAASGVFKIRLDIKNVSLDVMTLPVDWILDLANIVLSRVTIPIDLPDDFKNKSRDAVDAFNYLTGQSVTTVEETTVTAVRTDLTDEGAKLTAAGDNEAELLENMVEDKEAEAVGAASNETTCATALAAAVENAAKEVPAGSGNQTGAASTIKEKLDAATAHLTEVAEQTATLAEEAGQALIAGVREVGETISGWWDSLTER